VADALSEGRWYRARLLPGAALALWGGGDGLRLVARQKLESAFTQIEHRAAELLKGRRSGGRAEYGFGVLEARVAAERHVQKAQYGEKAHGAFHESSAEITEAEHGAIVGGVPKN
jgi:hypothetical protein